MQQTDLLCAALVWVGNARLRGLDLWSRAAAVLLLADVRFFGRFGEEIEFSEISRAGAAARARCGSAGDDRRGL